MTLPLPLPPPQDVPVTSGGASTGALLGRQIPTEPMYLTLTVDMGIMRDSFPTFCPNTESFTPTLIKTWY